MPSAQAAEMGDACIKAAKAKHPVLEMHPSDQVTFERVDGSDWRVRTSLNWQTKWTDNWFEVTCVVGWVSPEVKVRSVDTKQGEPKPRNG